MSALQGMAELSKKLQKIDEQTSRKILTAATGQSVTPIIRQMKALAPVGTAPHRTYKKRLVAPGFGRRQITKSTRINRTTGSAETVIGVRREAFYLIQFYDQRPGRTPYTISKRRVSSGSISVTKAHARVTAKGLRRIIPKHTRNVRGRKTIQVSPYTLPAKPWFSRVFENGQATMEQRMASILRDSIMKAIGNG